MSQTGQLAENLYYSYDQDELGFCACGNIATVKWSVAVGAPTFKVTCRNPDCLPPRFALPFPRQEHGLSQDGRGSQAAAAQRAA